MKSKAKVAVLASGSGSNLQALIEAARANDYPAEIVVVGSNVKSAKALERAQVAGIATEVIEHQGFETREAFEEAWVDTLTRHQVEWVCLAGFMRLLGKTFLAKFAGRTLNIHPSLLPAFPGLHAPRQALEYGVKVTGCTVHLVDEGMDRGPILGQSAVAVLEADDEASLAARILTEEHRLYPKVLRMMVSGQSSVQGRLSIHHTGPSLGHESLRNPGDN